MFAIVQTIFNSFFRFFNLLEWLWAWLAYWVTAVWGAGVHVLQLVINVAAGLLVFVLQVVTDLIMALFALILTITPEMYAGPGIMGGLPLNQVNRYLPFTEVAALSAVWIAIFGGIGAYKLAKFIRGAG